MNRMIVSAGSCCRTIALLLLCLFLVQAESVGNDQSLAVVARGIASVDGVQVEPEAAFAELLSAYNLFLDPQQQVPNEGVIPYELNTPHFADHAMLRRFLWLPPGESCHYQSDGQIEYPHGAVIVSTVSYPFDQRQPELGHKLVETRLWIRRSSGWEGAQYVWNDQATDARLALVGHQVDVQWTDLTGTIHQHRYRVPNRNQCIQCHAINDQLVPLGPMHARNLHRSVDYSFGSESQLQHWSTIGLLTGLPENAEVIPHVPKWNQPDSGDLDSRARAYLDMNCSGCHRPGGIAMTSGLDLRFEQREPVRFGIYKAPVAAGRAAGNGRFVIEPGQPDKSILLRRLESTDPGIRMPIVGRSLVDEEGVQLIRDWISAMQYAELTAQQQELDQRVIGFQQRLASGEPFPDDRLPEVNVPGSE